MTASMNRHLMSAYAMIIDLQSQASNGTEWLIRFGDFQRLIRFIQRWCCENDDKRTHIEKGVEYEKQAIDNEPHECPVVRFLKRTDKEALLPDEDLAVAAHLLILVNSPIVLGQISHASKDLANQSRMQLSF